MVISHTTRPPRRGERDGRDYHFVSDREFDRLTAAGEFAEWAFVHEHRYGTSRTELLRGLHRGGPRDLLVEVDVQGADALREDLPEAVTIFIEPPAFEDLRRRIEGRGREKRRAVDRRLAAARAELRCAADYDYRLVNDDFAAAAARLAALIRGHRSPGSSSGQSPENDSRSPSP